MLDAERKAQANRVAPRRGAWIEIASRLAFIKAILVAPRRGAWIEIKLNLETNRETFVAPRRGAWIEINTVHGTHHGALSRTPQGCVDRN